MPIEREKWGNKLTLNDFLSFSCPTCGTGHFYPDAEKLFEKETIESIKRSNDPACCPGPETYKGRFSAIFKCSNNRCEEQFHIIGDSFYDEDITFPEEGNPILNWKIIYAPRFISPSPIILKINDSYPNIIATDILKISEIFWTDNCACGNRIRVCLEHLVDHLKIPKRIGKKKLSLHSRILEIKNRASKYADIVDHITAIKWLGNEASHSDSLTKDDLFDSLDLLEHILSEIFNNRSTELLKIANTINRNKGSIRKFSNHKLKL